MASDLFARTGVSFLLDRSGWPAATARARAFLSKARGYSSVRRLLGPARHRR